ncbi:MAG: hypothetical protein ABJF65_00145 [Reichenbachiella sp.]|uniref:hypothetical protein n=1 Tax=Reichenbachiella sp. TaxID=2184521 RepID=UPI0032652C15
MTSKEIGYEVVVVLFRTVKIGFILIGMLGFMFLLEGHAFFEAFKNMEPEKIISVAHYSLKVVGVFSLVYTILYRAFQYWIPLIKQNSSTAELA